jgi:GNAT superfamily N-acetyltransferase
VGKTPNSVIKQDNKMTSKLVIRDAHPDEIAAIRALTLDAYEPYAKIMSPDAWAGLKGAVMDGLAAMPPVERIVAEHDGSLVGSVMLVPANHNAYGSLATANAVPELRLLAVKSQAQGNGIGRQLVEACIRRAYAMGATALGLHTSRSMQVAQRLYERMGFVRYPADDFQPEGAELVMAYRLPLEG